MKSQKTFLILLTVLFLSSLYVNFVQMKSNAPLQTAGLNSNNALCEIAKEHLHDHWSEHQKSIEKVIHVVNSPTEMTAKLKADLTQISETLSLTGSQKEEFTKKYEANFGQHVENFRAHLNQKSPEWAGMFQTLKKFYFSEDQLVREHFGPEAVEKFRISQVKKRTMMLALIGQYANIPWDQNISW